MKNRISINGRNGAFGAYIALPETAPAPAVVVLHEVFGVNADIRKTCDELAEQGFIAVAPDLFWRQEPTRWPNLPRAPATSLFLVTASGD
jgi:carboxymethylenebutenolidase